MVRPGVVSILERGGAARSRARDETWARVAPLLASGFAYRREMSMLDRGCVREDYDKRGTVHTGEPS